MFQLPRASKFMSSLFSFGHVSNQLFNPPLPCIYIYIYIYISMPQSKPSTNSPNTQKILRMDSRHSSISVLMFPWLAHDHISPFLDLAKKLTNRNFHVYFCSTPINLGPIKQNLSEKHSQSIQLVEIHLPSLPDLPPHYHTTNGLPPHLISTLKTALDMASTNFNTILKKLKPDLVIYDFLLQ